MNLKVFPEFENSFFLKEDKKTNFKEYQKTIKILMYTKNNIKNA